MKFCTVFLLLVLVGCTTRPEGVVFYQLMGETSGTISPATEIIDDKPLLVIERPHLLGVLSEPGIAVRFGEHELQNANYHFWSSRPNELLENQAYLGLQSSRWLALTRQQFQPLTSNAQPYFQLTWQLSRFNATMQGHVEIEGQWQLYLHKPGVAPVLRTVVPFSVVQDIEQEGYGFVASALSEAWQTALIQTRQSLKNLIADLN